MSSDGIQHVNFWWLKEPGNPDHVRQLIEAGAMLGTIPGVRAVSVGPRIELDWDDPAHDFDVGLIVSFASRAAMDAYMPHPTHLEVIEISQALTARYHSFYFAG